MQGEPHDGHGWRSACALGCAGNETSLPGSSALDAMPGRSDSLAMPNSALVSAAVMALRMNDSSFVHLPLGNEYRRSPKERLRCGKVPLGLPKMLRKEIYKNQEPIQVVPGPRHRSCATTACVANSLFSIFVQHGCVTWPPFCSREGHLAAPLSSNENV